MKKELLNNEHCPESWEKMSITDFGRLCDKCNVDLLDLTEKSIGDIVKNHVGVGKCVSITNYQAEILALYRSFGKTVVASSIFLGASFFNQTYAQTIEESKSHEDSCLVTGNAINQYKKPFSNAEVYVMIGRDTYETRTDSEGRFAFNIPKNCIIGHSNIEKLKAKNVRKKDSIKLHKVMIRDKRRRMGWL